MVGVHGSFAVVPLPSTDTSHRQYYIVKFSHRTVALPSSTRIPRIVSFDRFPITKRREVLRPVNTARRRGLSSSPAPYTHSFLLAARSMCLRVAGGEEEVVGGEEEGAAGGEEGVVGGEEEGVVGGEEEGESHMCMSIVCSTAHIPHHTHRTQHISQRARGGRGG